MDEAVEAKIYLNTNPRLALVYSEDESLYLWYTLLEEEEFGNIPKEHQVIVSGLLAKWNWSGKPSPYVFREAARRHKKELTKAFKAAIKYLREEVDGKKIISSSQKKTKKSKNLIPSEGRLHSPRGRVLRGTKLADNTKPNSKVKKKKKIRN